jgi:hypothetical protein
MNVTDFVKEIGEALYRGMQTVEYGKFGVFFNVHEGRIVSIEKTFTSNIRKKTPDIPDIEGGENESV